MMNRAFRYLLLLSLLWLPLPASAACLVLGCTCTASATGVAFGTYNPFGGNLDAAGNVRVSCTGVLGLLLSADYSIALDRGTHSASFSPRQMGSGANLLNYDLYTSGSYATIWGDGTSGTGVVTGTVTLPALLGSGFTDNPVYGRIPGSQTSTAVGSYSDTITVTVTYD